MAQPLLASVAAEPVTTDGRAAERERDPGQRVWRVVPAAMQPHAPAWMIGKLVHEALAAWRFPAADGFFEQWAEAHARSYGLTDAGQLADAVHASRKLLLRFQAHPLHAAMAAADRRLHEIPYSLMTHDGIADRGQQGIENGIIDALFLRHGTWTLVEFKTDHVRDAADLDRLLADEDYLAQAGRYAAAVAQLSGQQPGVLLCILDYGGSVYLQKRTGTG